MEGWRRGSRSVPTAPIIFRFHSPDCTQQTLLLYIAVPSLWLSGCIDVHTWVQQIWLYRCFIWVHTWVQQMGPDYTHASLVHYCCTVSLCYMGTWMWVHRSRYNRWAQITHTFDTSPPACCRTFVCATFFSPTKKIWPGGHFENTTAMHSQWRKVKRLAITARFSPPKQPYFGPTLRHNRHREMDKIGQYHLPYM